jgi:tetratricopeptide (TPR) repeat protein
MKLLKFGMVVLATLIVNPNFLQAQLKKSAIKKLTQTGDNLIWSGKYQEAEQIFLKLLQNDSTNKIHQFKVAICETHLPDKKLNSYKTFSRLEKIGNKKDFEDFDYHYAISCYNNFMFEKAQEHFTKYYEHINSTTKDANLINHIQLLMDYNTNAMFLSKDTLAKIRITNLGSPLNSSDLDYSPFVTPSEDVMIFTHMGAKSTGGKMSSNLKSDEKYGKYYEDILVSHRDTLGLWSEPYSFPMVNTKSNESAAGLSLNGDRLFVYKNLSGNNGEIFESYLDSTNNWTLPVSLKGEINSPYWEGSVGLSVDAETIYFSSDRVGGYGGKDIYSAKLQADGSWREIKNLGPEINTQYDEDSPYIHPDNKTLYFSSNGTRSIGMYDIFYSEMKEDGNFGLVVNAGIPINTLGNDRFYILSADGQTGYFSRESNGEETNHDIFIITPGRVGSPPLLAIINGKVFLDNLKEEATIIVRDRETGKIQGRYKTNPNSDAFTMLLNPGKNYIIDVEVNGKVKYTDTLNSTFVDQFIKLSHDYYVYSEDYKGDKPVLSFTLQEKVQMTYNELTGYQDVDTNLVLAHTFITTHKDTLRLHDLNNIVKENRIDFYENHQKEAKEDHVKKEILELAKKTEITDNVEYKKELGYKPQIHNQSNDILAQKQIDGKPTPDEQKQINAIFHPTFTDKDLVYRVQVAAYRKPQNYQWHGRSIYGDVLEVSYPDGITRFTIGGTKHLVEAQELIQRLIKFGIEDAFIVAFKGEERIPLYQLISE